MGMDLKIFKEDISFDKNSRTTRVLTEVFRITNRTLIDKLQEESMGFWNMSSECGAVFELPKRVIMNYKEDILKDDKAAYIALLENSTDEDYFYCDLSF